jgi:hypothetical protein
MADPREQLAKALEGYLTPEQMEMLINEVLAVQKRVSADFSCKACGQRQRQIGTMSDAKAVALALPDLLNQAYGRPSEQEHVEQVLFTRLTKLDEPEAA